MNDRNFEHYKNARTNSLELEDTKTGCLTLEDPNDLPFGGDCWNTKSINHDAGASTKTRLGNVVICWNIVIPSISLLIFNDAAHKAQSKRSMPRFIRKRELQGHHQH